MDLSNQANWQLVLQESKRIRVVKQNSFEIQYLPIPEIKTAVNSSVIKISLRSETASSRWFLGAWANFYCYAHTGYALLSQGSKPCKINDDTLFIFDQPTEQIPYSISLQFPKYLEDITYEIWQYIDQSGRYSSSLLLSELKESVEGQEIILKNVLWEPIEGTDLVVSTFTEPVKYTRFIVGRFALIESGQIISDPMVAVSARQLVVRFTSNQRILPNTVKVQVNPI